MKTQDTLLQNISEAFNNYIECAVRDEKGGSIKFLLGQNYELQEQVNKLEQRLEDLTSRFDAISERLDGQNARLDEVVKDTDTEFLLSLESKLQDVEQSTESIDQRVDELASTVDDLECAVDNIDPDSIPDEDEVREWAEDEAKSLIESKELDIPDEGLIQQWTKDTVTEYSPLSPDISGLSVPNHSAVSVTPGS